MVSTVKPLLIGVSARALFNLDYATGILRKDGLDSYREYQSKQRAVPLKPGIAYRFVKRMLGLNSIAPEDAPLVELAIISHMDPDTGCRVMNSLEPLHLDATESVFTSGDDLVPYLKAMDVKLYLSMNRQTVKDAIGQGVPAGTIVTKRAITRHDTDDGQIRIAFDFDGCIGADDAERIFQENGLEAFNEHEADNATLPLDTGPMYPFIEGLSRIQKAEDRYAKEHDDYRRRLRIAIITARSATSGIRAMNTLDSWGISVDDAFYMGGHDKVPVLSAYRPHLFLDDSPENTELARTAATSVHVPFGVSNESAHAGKEITVADADTAKEEDKAKPAGNR